MKAKIIFLNISLFIIITNFINAQSIGDRFSINNGTNALYYRITNLTPATVEVTAEFEYGHSLVSTYSGDITLPASVNYNGTDYSVTAIGNLAFHSCLGLTSVTIPNSVTTIGNKAFGHCSGLTSVTIPDSVTAIGGEAFIFCGALTSITIPNSVTTIREGTFYNCSGLTSVTIPNSVTTIKNNAFGHCSGLTSVTIPDSATTIGLAAFEHCSGLTSVTIPNSITTIKGFAFSYCGELTSVTISNSITTIEEGSFMSCIKLTSVTIPDSVTTIEGGAFGHCSGLTSIVIPNSVTTIGGGAFGHCSGLTSVTTEISDPNMVNMGLYIFEETPNTKTLHVPCGTKPAYETTDQWSDFTTISDIADCTILSIDETTLNREEIIIYPNPATDIICISSKNAITINTIYNMAGEKVFNSTSKTNQINVSNLPEGIYLIRLENEKGNKITKKLIKK